MPLLPASIELQALRGAARGLACASTGHGALCELPRLSANHDVPLLSVSFLSSASGTAALHHGTYIFTRRSRIPLTIHSIGTRQTSSQSCSKFRFCVPVAIVHARSRHANTDVLAHAVHPAPSRKRARYVCTHINTRTWALERTREHRRARIHTLLITHSTQHRHRVTQHRVDNSPAIPCCSPSHLLEIRR